MSESAEDQRWLPTLAHDHFAHGNDVGTTSDKSGLQLVTHYEPTLILSWLPTLAHDHFAHWNDVGTTSDKNGLQLVTHYEPTLILSW